MKNRIALQRAFTLILHLTPLALAGQSFVLPPFPKFDKVKTEKWEKKVREKTYFLKKKKVLCKEYDVSSHLESPFSGLTNEEDSLYTYFRGANGDSYESFYFSRTKGYIIQLSWSESSLFLEYKKWKWTAKKFLAESGKYQFEKNLSNSNIYHNDKFRVGKWFEYNEKGKTVREVDFDSCLVDGEPFLAKNNLEKIEAATQIAGKKLIEVYGEAFFSSYIVFNQERSGFFTVDNYPRRCTSYNYPLSSSNMGRLQFSDLWYDIKLSGIRYPLFHFVIDEKGEIWANRSEIFGGHKVCCICPGLDKRNGKDFHSTVKYWEETAKEAGFNISHKDFNSKFEYEPTDDFDGRLYFILEMIIKEEERDNCFIRQARRIKINAWTGEKYEDFLDYGICVETLEDR